jgi:hypothetical protein
MPSWHQRGSLTRLKDPQDYVLVVSEHQPITRLVRVTVEPGGPLDVDWCDLQEAQIIVIP